MQAIRDQIVARIERLGAGKAFSAKDFQDIASRGTIDMALGSLTRQGQSAVSGAGSMTSRRSIRRSGES
jgi:hypothetical protein